MKVICTVEFQILLIRKNFLEFINKFPNYISCKFLLKFYPYKNYLVIIKRTKYKKNEVIANAERG